MSSDNRFIVSGSEDKSIKVFDLQTKQQLHHFADAHQGTIILSFLSSTPPLILFHRHSMVSCGVERQQVHRFGVLGVETSPSRCSICRPSSNCTTLQMHIKVPSFFLSFLLPRHSSSFIGQYCQLRCRATTGSSFRGLQTTHRFGVFRQVHQGVRSADQAATAPLCRCTSRYHHSFFPFFYPATHPLS